MNATDLDLARRIPRALNRASDLTNALAADLKHVGDLDVVCARARTLARNLDYTVARAINRSNGPAPDLNRASDLAYNLTRDLANTRDLLFASELNYVHDMAAARAYADEIVRLVARADTRARSVAAARPRPGDLARSRPGDGDINQLHDPALTVARGQRGIEHVAPSAGFLLSVTARLLPAGDRAHFSEEFLSELWEVAHAGTGRLGQLAYSARQLGRAWSLRAELQGPHRRRAVP
jgi:hypothetical protein